MLGFTPLAAAPLGDDGGVINYALTTNSITTGAPVVDQAQLTVVSNLQSNSITTGAPVIDTSDISQNHELTSVSITTGQPVVDSPSAPQNYALTSTEITTGAPLVGELYSVPSYPLTASGLFDSTVENYFDVMTNNRGSTSSATGTWWSNADYATNLSVNSTGISFRLYGAATRSETNGSFTFLYWWYSDVTLNWSGSTALTASSPLTTSSLPTSRYDIYTNAGLTNFFNAIDTAIANANLGSVAYDWIPSEVVVGSSGSNSFYAQVSGSGSNADTYSFPTSVLSTLAGAKNTTGYYDPTYTEWYVLGNRFLFANYGVFRPTSATVSQVQDTGFAAARFDRAVQTVQVRGALIQVSEAFPTEEIITGAPVIDTSALTQTHELSGGAITTGAPVVGQATLSITHNLQTSAITTAAPVVDTTDLQQNHALQPAEITTGAPVIDGSNITQNHVLTGAMTVGAPIIDQPVISQHFELTTNSITTGAPSIDAATVGVTHNLTSSEITSGVPAIDTTNLSQIYNLQPVLSVGSPTIDAITITQNHVLASVSITTGAPSIDRPGDNWSTVSIGLDGSTFWTEQTSSIPPVENFWTEAA